jgi:hypothetical protein
VGLLERRGELRTAIERIGALAGFHLDALIDNAITLGVGEAANRLALRLDAEARFGLFARRDAQIGDDRPHFRKTLGPVRNQPRLPRFGVV